MTTRTSDGLNLLAAVEEGDPGSVSPMIDRGVDLNAASENGWTPLMAAILHGNTQIVELLLAGGADPNLTTRSEENPCRSALAVAVSNGRTEAVRLLIAHGADVEAADYNGLTAIDLARKLASRPLHRSKMADIVSLLRSRQGVPSRLASSPSLTASARPYSNAGQENPPAAPNLPA